MNMKTYIYIYIYIYMYIYIYIYILSLHFNFFRVRIFRMWHWNIIVSLCQIYFKTWGLILNSIDKPFVLDFGSAVFSHLLVSIFLNYPFRVLPVLLFPSQFCFIFLHFLLLLGRDALLFHLRVCFQVMWCFGEVEFHYEHCYLPSHWVLFILFLFSSTILRQGSFLVLS